MVNVQKQNVPGNRKANNNNPHQRRFGQLIWSRTPANNPQQLFVRIVSQSIAILYSQRHCRMDTLDKFSVTHLEAGSQTLMSTGQLFKHRSQSYHIKHPINQHRSGQMVRGIAIVVLTQYIDALLR